MENQYRLAAAGTVATLQTLADLRAYEPTTSGESVLVIEYNAGTLYGGGIFISDITDTATPNDDGVNVRTTGGKLWTRQIGDYNLVNVTHFGAVPDGVTDCVEAVIRMWYWVQQVTASGLADHLNLGIRFPAGRFMLSKFDISNVSGEVSHFRLCGEPVKFGYFATTTLVSDKKNNEYMFKVKARRVEITGIAVDGESSYETGAVNTKGFFRNIVEGGQYLRVSCVTFSNLGGRGLDLLDTLDCKIDQWYASKCHATVIYGAWSGREAGSWDHLTAIELSNFNIQSGYDKPMIDLQRATQCILHNGWIEHTENPGDLSNGEWVINTLSLEGNGKPLACHYARLTIIALNVQGANGLDTSEAGERWLSVYEDGTTHIENYGVNIHGSLSYDYLSNLKSMDNRAESAAWFLLGEIEAGDYTTQVQIQLVASATYNTWTETQTDYTGKTPEGGALLSLQNINGTVNGSWSATGASPIVAAYVEPGSNNMAKIYLKIAAWTGYVKAYITTNAHNRFEAGVHFRFIPAYSKADAATVTDLESKSDSWCFMQHWMGNDQVGFGYNNNHDLLFHAPVSDNKMRVLVNGTPYTLALTPVTE